MIEGEPECVVFPLVPAGPQPEDESPLGRGIDGRRLLGEHRGSVEAGRCDEWTDLDRRGRRGDRCKRGPHFPWPTIVHIEFVEQMIAEPEGIEPDGLGRPGHRNELGKRHFPFDFRELDTDQHAGLRHLASVAMTRISSLLGDPANRPSSCRVAVPIADYRSHAVGHRREFPPPTTLVPNHGSDVVITNVFSRSSHGS